MNYLRLPFFTELEKAQTILLAGAGGGFDIFGGLPLYFGLRSIGKKVYLANLSFSHLEAATGNRLAPAALEITADSVGARGYFAEFYLSQWFRQRNEEVPIYCFERVGCKPLLEGYRAVVNHLQVDAVVLIDGGTDSLMRGDEAGLGTPEEDVASIAAVDELEVENKFLVCLGFGVDSFHGVCHAHGFEAVADLTKQGAFLGSFSVLLAFRPETTLKGDHLPSHGATGPGHFALGIEAEAFDAWRKLLQGHGVAIEKEVEWPRGGRSIYFRGPAGNSVELVTPGVWGLPSGW